MVSFGTPITTCCDSLVACYLCVAIIVHCVEVMHLYSVCLYYRVRQNKISQCENCDIYIMQEYLYTKFSTFIHHVCLHKSV